MLKLIDITHQIRLDTRNLVITHYCPYTGGIFNPNLVGKYWESYMDLHIDKY
jgi:hypothetical protein